MLEKHLPSDLSEIAARWDKTKHSASSRMLPPPNITGSLHMGHAYEHTLIDFEIRWRRMQGIGIELIPGLDHAAIATNRILNAQLKEKKLTKEQLGRDGFNQYAWGWKQLCEKEQLSQMQMIGLSASWDKLSFTLDERSRLITREAFIKLWEKGLIYQATKPTPWCESCATTLSDIEIEDAKCSRCQGEIKNKDIRQTYLRMQPIAAHFKKLIAAEGFSTSPTEKKEEMLEWAEKIHDWCISRQLWWGHPIPLEYKDEETRILSGEEGWTPETDTLDTWFTSSLWPIILEGKSSTFNYGTLTTGNDLLFFWALRMMMLTSYLTGELPFERINFHGMIRDEHGRKMSKSFGNTLDPAPIIEKWGPDTLRIAFLRSSRPGADISLSESDFKGARGLLDKLWNLTRFALNAGCRWDDEADGEGLLQRWLLSEASELHEKCSELFENQEYAKAYALIANFLEEDLSSTFIPSMLKGDSQAKRALSSALRTALALMHPGAPFTTEKLAAELGAKNSLASFSWDESRERDREAELYHRELKAIKDTLNKLGTSADMRADLSQLSHPSELLKDLKLTQGLEGGSQSFQIEGKEFSLGTKENLKQRAKAQAELEKILKLLEDPGFRANAPKERQEKLENQAKTLQMELS